MIYTLGESLMDIIIAKDSQTVVKPGGSLLNVSVSLGRAGKEVSLVTEIGDDEVGRLLMDFLSENGVLKHLIKKYGDCKTSLAIATLDESQKPSYSFYKAYPEKRFLPKPPVFSERDILILGSMYSRDLDIKDDINSYLESAKRGGALIVYDPNVRHNHQIRNADSREMLLKNLAYADVIKGSDEDFLNIFNLNSISGVKDELRKINNQALIIITLGEKGSIVYYRDIMLEVPSININVVSTIGAGDAFTAGVVNSIIDQGLLNRFDQLSENNLRRILEEGTGFSSLVCRTMDNYIPKR